MLKYPDVAGMLIGGIWEVTTNTRAANIAAKAILSAILGELPMNAMLSLCYDAISVL